jgi:hypothetical protein
MPTKEEDFKQRFITILRDLQAEGKDDPETIWLIGSLAAALVDKVGASSWPDLKQALTAEAYDGLLRDFEAQGNALYQQGKGKQAYAIQTLAVSVIARTQSDPQVQTGSALLDEFVDRAIGVYRRASAAGTPVN